MDDKLHKYVFVACLYLAGAVLGCGDERKPVGDDRAEPHEDGGLPALDADVEAARDAAIGGDGGSTVNRSEGVDAAPGGGVDAADSSRPTVARGDPSGTYWDLRVRGIGLASFEGREVVVRLGGLDDPTERIAAGSARVVNGAFELFFPQAWEAKRYKLKRGYIDANGNGRCDAAQDMLFGDSRATQTDVLDVRADLSMPTVTDFARSWDPDRDCAELNEPWPLP